MTQVALTVGRPRAGSAAYSAEQDKLAQGGTARALEAGFSLRLKDGAVSRGSGAGTHLTKRHGDEKLQGVATKQAVIGEVEQPTSTFPKSGGNENTGTLRTVGARFQHLAQSFFPRRNTPGGQ